MDSGDWIALELDCAWMERTYPFWGPMPDPPAAPTDQEFWTLKARVAAYDSDRVKALLEKWNKEITREFWLGTMYLRDMEQAGKIGRAITQEEWGRPKETSTAIFTAFWLREEHSWRKSSASSQAS